jgi:hypothetical protein
MTIDTDRSGIRHPERWLAFLRIVVGLWFLKGIVTKLDMALLWGFLPFPVVEPRWVTTMPRLLTRYTAENPIPFYKEFIEGTVLAYPVLFANLTAYGEAAVGIGLTFGIATVIAATIGLLLSLLYGMATQHMTPGQQGFHILLVASMIAFLFSRAGRRWGLDPWLRERWRWWRAIS